ncbi:MAG: iron ABC transporter permease [Phycisphaerae bacterium]|nr:iron ABC transporter permease [Betaproteobacteria bacterium]MBM4115291.1 iron ABC transporter permease [Phycisphaerae bacterium]
MKPWQVHAALAASLPLLSLMGLGLGGVHIDAGSLWASLLQPGAASLSVAEAAHRAIVFDLRLPRVLLAVLVGATLAMAGALLQTATRNDLADPFLFGLSSGAAAGAVAVISLTGERFGIWTLPLASFTGGLVAAAGVLLLARRSAGQGAERIVLAGLAMSFLFGALTHVLVFAGDQRAAHSVLFWSLGGLGLARWDNLLLALVGFGALALFVALRHRALDALLAGDEVAHSLGVAPQRLRRQVLIITALATACCVALAGVIGFVGLMVPHLMRRSAGLLHATLVPACALLGAVLLLGSDLLARVLMAPQELPVGIVIASIGAAFVIGLLWRRSPAAT